jgi:hypothetical protein
LDTDEKVKLARRFLLLVHGDGKLQTREVGERLRARYMLAHPSAPASEVAAYFAAFQLEEPALRHGLLSAQASAGASIFCDRAAAALKATLDVEDVDILLAKMMEFSSAVAQASNDYVKRTLPVAHTRSLAAAFGVGRA